jgi:hypothetical protein
VLGNWGESMRIWNFRSNSSKETTHANISSANYGPLELNYLLNLELCRWSKFCCYIALECSKSSCLAERMSLCTANTWSYYERLYMLIVWSCIPPLCAKEVCVQQDIYMLPVYLCCAHAITEIDKLTQY